MSTERKTTVRPFEGKDFEAVASLMPPEWRFKGCSRQEDDAQARMDSAGMLVGCQYRLVAEVDGEVAGVLLARLDGEPEPQDSAVWETVWKSQGEILLAGGPQARRAYLYEIQLEDRGKLIVDQAGDAMGPNNELELFVVGPAARGCGVGSALMGAFETMLASTNRQGYWLQTDSTCSWEWYENHGYTRVADVPLDGAYPMPDACASAGAECDGRRPQHVFMYRKEILTVHE